MNRGTEKNKAIDNYAKIIWQYMLMDHQMKKVDVIFALGAQDLSVPKRAAELYHQGYADLVVCSGGLGKVSDAIFIRSEAEMFKDVLQEHGVPEDKIILETQATNTEENILFTKKVLLEKNIHTQSMILVHKPYMERRSYATFKKRWTEPDIVVTSPVISFEDYTLDPDERELCIHVMVGDLQRIKEYPNLGFQIEQDIPDEVWSAYEYLVAAGYTKYLINAK